MKTTVAALVVGAVLFAPAAHADNGNYLNSVRANGITGSDGDLLEAGTWACEAMQQGIPDPSVIVLVQA